MQRKDLQKQYLISNNYGTDHAKDHGENHTRVYPIKIECLRAQEMVEKTKSDYLVEEPYWGGINTYSAALQSHWLIACVTA